MRTFQRHSWKVPLMVSAVLDQDSLTLLEVSRLLPSRPHANTLRRWASKKGLNGIRLRTFKCGRRVCTTKAYLEQFLAACSGETDPVPEPSDSHRDAERKLDRRV